MVTPTNTKTLETPSTATQHGHAATAPSHGRKSTIMRDENTRPMGGYAIGAAVVLLALYFGYAYYAPSGSWGTFTTENSMNARPPVVAIPPAATARNADAPVIPVVPKTAPVGTTSP